MSNESAPSRFSIAKESEDRVNQKVVEYYTQARERQNDPSFDFSAQSIEAARKCFIEELEEQGTDPRLVTGQNERDELNAILQTGTSEGSSSRLWRELLIRIAQQYRLTPDQIDALQSKIYINEQAS